MPSDNGHEPEKVVIVEDEAPKPTDWRWRLYVELKNLVQRLQAEQPDFTPPPFSPQRFVQLIERAVPTPLKQQVGQTLRQNLNEDLLDIDTWKGAWYLINYNLKYQFDFAKRRLTGAYETDEWGMDAEFVEVIKPIFDLFYTYYWRVETVGIEHIPQHGRCLLVANHSGQFALDAHMIMTAVLNEHPDQRMVRHLYAQWLPRVPFLPAIFERLGQAAANQENGERLLAQDQLVNVFPEGIQGVSKPFTQRYQLAPFDQVDFVAMAMATDAPIVPTAVIGAEETYITLGQSTRLARLMGLPYFPLTVRFPWLGLLGLVPYPSKWAIIFGKPIAMDNYGSESAQNRDLVQQLRTNVHESVQQIINAHINKN